MAERKTNIIPAKRKTNIIPLIDSSTETGERIGKYKKTASTPYFHGAQADIYLVSSFGKKYAAKVYYEKPNTEVFDRLKAINHPNVLKIYDTGFTESGNFYVITDYFENGTLDKNMGDMTEYFLMESAVDQLNEGIRCLHTQGIYHNDIKPANIFISNNGKNLILGDFGIAIVNRHHMDDGMDEVTKPFEKRLEGSIDYMAPEADENWSPKTDYFSLGMTLLELYTKHHPLLGMTKEVARKKINNESIEIPVTMNKYYARLVKGLLEHNPGERLVYQDVKEWCRNHKVLGEYVAESEDRDYPVVLTSVRFNGINYSSTKDYTEAMAKNWLKALDEFKRGKILENIKNANPTLAEEYKIELKKYKDEEIALAWLLFKLNPKQGVVYRRLQFKSFGEYHKKAYEAMTTGGDFEIPFDMNLLAELASHSGVDPKVLDYLNHVNNYTGNKNELLCNYLYEPVIYRGKTYTSLAGLEKIVFNDEFKPIDDPRLFDREFFYMLQMAKGIDGARLVEIIKASGIKRCALFSILATGKVKGRYKSLTFDSHDSIKEYVKNAYEKKMYVREVSDFLTSDGAINFYKALDTTGSTGALDALDFLKTLKKTDNPDDVIRLCYYRFFDKNMASCIVDGITFKTKDDVNKYLSTGDVVEKRKKLESSPDFKIWYQRALRG